MSKGSVGSSISPKVSRQLSARSDIMEKPSKTVEELQLIHGNVPWVSLRSSVNRFTGARVGTESGIIDIQAAEELRKYSDITSITIKSDDTLARNFILSSGTRTSTGPREGISFSPNTTDLGAIYSNTERLGFRPMPGITGLKVNSKNTYGTLLEATVNFVVWTVEDLELCELLFFRPGYTALLEWGHSIWVDTSDGQPKIRQMGGDYMTLPNEDVFGSLSPKEFDKKINDAREKFDGNYDGMFGFITNFSFALRPDLGYDCTVKIVSRGVILEGLRVKPATTVIGGGIQSDEEETVRREYKSIFHFLFSNLEKDKAGKSSEGSPEDRERTGLDKLLSTQEMGPEEIDYESRKIQLPETEYKSGGIRGFRGPNWFNGKTHLRSIAEKAFEEGSIEREGLIQISNQLDDFLIFELPNVKVKSSFDKEKAVIQYIRLGDLLMILESLNNVYSTGGEQLVRFRTRHGIKFGTFKDHYSLDPLVAILPKSPESEEYKTLTLEKTLMSKALKHSTSLGGPEDILNILVCTRLVERELDSATEESRSEGILGVIRRILSAVQRALGEVNSFDIAQNHLTNIFEVVDREKVGTEEQEIVELDLIGLRSTLTSQLTISSTISSQVATQVAIAAQGNVVNPEENLRAMLDWNLGAVDRHIPIKLVGKDIKENKKGREEYLKEIKSAYGKFNGTVAKNAGTNLYDEKSFLDILLEGTKDIQQIYNKKVAIEEGIVRRGVVPIELSLTLRGIHGLLIGTTFKIKKGLLPSRYDDWGFIIVGLEHTIESGKNWTTSIRTQFFSTPFLIGQGSIKSTVVTPIEGEKYSDLQVSGEDPAIIYNPFKVGSLSYSSSPLGQQVLREKKVGKLSASDLVVVQRGSRTIHKQAKKAFDAWEAEVQLRGIRMTVSSGYRSDAENNAIYATLGKTPTKNSAHLYGGAVDISQLYSRVKGSTDPQVNVEGRIGSSEYKTIAEVGAKHGWYNPWRLSDAKGMDEMWHFEYWGKIGVL